MTAAGAAGNGPAAFFIRPMAGFFMYSMKM